MSQKTINFADNPYGKELLDDYLAPLQNNMLTSHSGESRPPYAQQGTKWLDISSTPWLLKMYDGTDDIVLGTVDSSTHLFTPAGLTDVVDYTQITNCITKIPQDIKLELTNGTLTLKAGSKVYKGDGTAVNITSDVSSTNGGTSNGFKLLFTSGTGFGAYLLEQCISSDTSPGAGYQIWFNTSDKIIYKDDSKAGNFEATNWSLPIAVVKTDSSKFTSIDQIFNGFGYIGSTIFALPGVEGLIPNGRNADGSLNNIKFATTSVLTLDNSTISNTNRTLRIDNGTSLDRSYEWYISEDNYFYNVNPNLKLSAVVVAEYSVGDGGRITSFNPKLPIKLADDQEVVHKTGNETIDGVKTFRNRLISIAPNIDTNVIPSSRVYNDFMLTMDKTANNQIGYYGNRQETNGDILSRIGSSRRKKDGSYIHTEISIGTTTDGTVFTRTPTPDLSSNDNNIVNTYWFNRKIQVVSTLPSNPDANVYYFVTNA